MEKKVKLFAFELAKKQEKKTKDQWKVRDGVAIAACTGPVLYGNYRARTRFSADGGYYC